MRISFLAAVVLCATTMAAAQNAPWDYVGKRGALAWGKLDPAYRACSQGHEQSPIDIRGARLNKALKPIEFHYIAGPVTLENTGQTIVVHVDPGSYIVAGGVRYDLVQFHFHHPSEEAVKGKLTDMDVHLLHKSADGKMAVIAVRLNIEVGDANATLATLWQHLPDNGGREREDHGHGESGRAAAGGPRLLDLHGLTDDPAMYRGRALVCLRESDEHQPGTVSRLCGGVQMNSRPLQDAHGRRIEANE